MDAGRILRANIDRRSSATSHARRTATPRTIDDACSHAWAHLLSRPSVDVGAERCSILRWLTTTATRYAWRPQQKGRMPARADIEVDPEHEAVDPPGAKG